MAFSDQKTRVYNSSKTIEVELRDVNLTWTYKILYGEYHPGAPMGLLLIVLGSVLVIVGIRKKKGAGKKPLICL